MSCVDAVLTGRTVDSDDRTDDADNGFESPGSRVFFITALANNGGILCVWLVLMLSSVVCVSGGSEQISFHSSPSLLN